MSIEEALFCNGNLMKVIRLEEAVMSSVKKLTVSKMIINSDTNIFKNFCGSELVFMDSKLPVPIVITSTTLKKLVLINTSAVNVTIAAESGVEHIEILSVYMPTPLSNGKHKFHYSCILNLAKPINTLVFKNMPMIYHDVCAPAENRVLPALQIPAVVNNLHLIRADLSDSKIKVGKFVHINKCMFTGDNCSISAPSGMVYKTDFGNCNPFEFDIPYKEPGEIVDHTRDFIWKNGVIAYSTKCLYTWVSTAFAILELTPEMHRFVTQHL